MIKNKIILISMCLVFAQGALASGRIFPDDSTKKCKEKKVKLEDVYDRISALDSMIQDLHSFVVDGKTSDNSAFMLRSEHQDALDSIKALNAKNRNLESKIEEKEKTIEEKEKTITEKNVAYTQLKNDKEALRQQKDNELQLKTKEIETYKANENEHATLVDNLVGNLLKEATADEATINDLMELDNKINAAENKKKLQGFLEIQSLIQSGNKITKSELKDNTIADFQKEMKKFENTQFKSAYAVLKQTQSNIEEYENLTCDIQNRINAILNSQLNSDQKKDRLKKRIAPVDKTLYPSLHEALEHAKKHLKSNLNYKCD